MNTISLSSPWLDRFSNAAMEGDISAMEKLKNLGVLHPDLAQDCMQRLEKAEWHPSNKFIADIGVAHKDHALTAIEILSNSRHYTQDHIVRIVDAHPVFVPAAIEAMARWDHVYSANNIGDLARRYPDWALLALDHLKMMRNLSAPQEINSIVKACPDLAAQGIQALEFTGIMRAATFIEDIALESRLHFQQAVASISKMRDEFAQHAQATQNELFQEIADLLDERAGRLTQLSRQP